VWGTVVIDLFFNVLQAAVNVVDTVLGFLIMFAAIGIAAVVVGVFGYLFERVGRKQ
jgi:hypothetical protein